MTNQSIKTTTFPDFLKVIGKYEVNDILEWALRFCFRNPYESITVVDEKACVQFMDRATEEFFGLEQGGAKGVDIREFLKDSNLPRIIASGKPMIGGIWELKGVRRICSVYPLKKNGKIIGAVGRILFNSLEEIERINGEIQRLKKEIDYLKQKEKKEYSALYNFGNILTTSKLMRETVETAQRIAGLHTDVLITGESGTGKELFAHSIHNFLHADKPFIKINCPAIPFELAESQLFGYEKGAFTGATSSGKAGIFEASENGTVFLDEISSLPLSIQAKLLRVLQEREVTRLGSTRTRKINFKSIAATNVDLRKLVGEGKFRDDLYYRVARATISIPPLRERREDIPLYLHKFLERINDSFKTGIKEFSHEALGCLVQYNWPGNVRQLINVLEQIAIRAWQDDRITFQHLPDELRTPLKGPATDRSVQGGALSMKDRVAEIERNLIASTLKQTNGNRRKAAMLLNMPRSTFYQKLKSYEMADERETIG
jgi:transcriptional regulator with PAS, ATPase and Fis domain